MFIKPKLLTRLPSVPLKLRPYSTLEMIMMVMTVIITHADYVGWRG